MEKTEKMEGNPSLLSAIAGGYDIGLLVVVASSKRDVSSRLRRVALLLHPSPVARNTGCSVDVGS